MNKWPIQILKYKILRYIILELGRHYTTIGIFTRNRH